MFDLGEGVFLGEVLELRREVRESALRGEIFFVDSRSIVLGERRRGEIWASSVRGESESSPWRGEECLEEEGELSSRGEERFEDDCEVSVSLVFLEPLPPLPNREKLGRRNPLLRLEDEEEDLLLFVNGAETALFSGPISASMD